MLDENANEESAGNGRRRGKLVRFVFVLFFSPCQKLPIALEDVPAKFPDRTADDKGNLRIAKLYAQNLHPRYAMRDIGRNIIGSAARKQSARNIGDRRIIEGIGNRRAFRAPGMFEKGAK